MSKIKVLIVGGGFAGVKSALELCDDENFEVVLLSKSDDFCYFPSLYHTATGGLSRQSSIPLNVIFNGKNVELIKDEALKLDRKTKAITTRGGKIILFDELIIALGTVTNYFGIKGLAEHSYGIKSMEEVKRLKKHLHAQITDEGQIDQNYVIVGGGPTGVELAGALPNYIHKIASTHGVRNKRVNVTLIEAQGRILPIMPKIISKRVAKHLRKMGIRIKLNSKVEGEDSDSLLVDGKDIDTKTVVWTAGMSNNPFFAGNDFNLTPKGKVVVDFYMRAEEAIYVLGDNANTPYSGMAQTALYDGIYVAENLKRKYSGGKMEAYDPEEPVYVLPAGPRWVAVKWGKFSFFGWVGYLLRNLADIKGFVEIEPFLKAADQWMSEFGEEEECSVCTMSVVK